MTVAGLLVGALIGAIVVCALGLWWLRNHIE